MLYKMNEKKWREQKCTPNGNCHRQRMDSRFSLEIIDSTELLRAKRERERVIDIEKDI